MEARRVRAREVGPDDEQAWRDLAGRAVDPNPLYEPDCVVPAAVHQAFGGAIDVVLAEEDGMVHGCMPVRRVRRWRRFPYPFVTTEVRRMVYCGTPLLDPDRGAEAMEAMLRRLRRDRRLTDGRVVVLQEVAEGGPVDRMVREGARRAGLRPYRHESWERPYLRRRPEATYSSTSHTKKDLKNMARLRRKLDAAVGGPVHLEDRSHDPAAVEELIRLEDAGYKAHIGVAMTTVPGETAYFRAMCDRFRDADRLRVYTLEAGGVICAVVLFVRARDGLMMLKVGYDERFARSSPGLQLHLDVIQHVHDHTDARWVDVCTYPGNQTLLRMYPDRTRFASFMVPLGRNPLDHGAVRAFAALRPAHKRLHDALAARRRAGGGVPGNARGDDAVAGDRPTSEHPVDNPVGDHPVDHPAGDAPAPDDGAFRLLAKSRSPSSQRCG